MKTPIVLQLQELASDSQHHLPDLLRKALLISSKLRLEEFRAWGIAELNGYENVEDIPTYRTITSQLKAVNPYHGLVPFIINNAEIANMLSEVKVAESIESLQHLLSNSSEKGSLQFPFAPEQKAALMEMQDGFGQLEPTRTIGRNQVAGILEKVRTKLLDWAKI